MGDSHNLREIFTDRPTPTMLFAPIEPITANPIIRELAGHQGAEIVCRPKIIPQHLLKARQWQYYQKIKVIKKLTTEQNQPIYDGIQLLAKPDDPIGPAINFVNQNASRLGVSYIDLNFGCPGHKVRPQKRGGELLQYPDLLMEVIEKSLKFATVPISLKIRKGYLKNDSPYKLLARIEKEFGNNIAWITVNRAPVKMGDVITKEVLEDFDVFEKSCEAVNYKIPIIANGGIIDQVGIDKISTLTKCSGIMIGRASLGNPAIFHEESKIRKEGSYNIQAQLEDLFQIVAKYSKGKSARWSTLGEMKRIMYNYIKKYYLSINAQIPPGFGFSKWLKQKYTPDEFIKKINFAFPTIPKPQIQGWLAFLY